MRLMRQATHLTGFPAPPPRLLFTEQGLGHGLLAIDCDQVPTARQAADQQQWADVGASPQRHDACRPPPGVVEDAPFPFLAVAARCDLPDNPPHPTVNIVPTESICRKCLPVKELCRAECFPRPVCASCDFKGLGGRLRVERPLCSLRLCGSLSSRPVDESPAIPKILQSTHTHCCATLKMTSCVIAHGDCFALLTMTPDTRQ